MGLALPCLGLDLALPCLGLDHPSGLMQVSHEERMEMEGEVTMPFVISTAFLIRTLEVQTLGR